VCGRRRARRVSLEPTVPEQLRLDLELEKAAIQVKES
jgi:hypothetical protein